MKQAKTYEPKIRKLLKGISQSEKPGADEGANPIEVMLLGILQANATEKQAEKALEAIRQEYVDFNELRVSPPKDLVECLGPDLPHPRAKARQILQALGSVYARVSRIDLEYLAKIPKRELRRLLDEMGLDEYAAGYLMMAAFGHHAIPVDQDLTECLIMEECVHPDSDAATVQAFLERLAPKKQTLAAHALFREFVQKHARDLEKKRQAEAEAREKAEAEARAAAEAEAKAKAQAEEEARQREEEKQARKAEKKKASRKKTTRKASSKKKAAKKSVAKRAAGTRKKSSGGTKKAARKKTKSARKSSSRKASAGKSKKAGKRK